MILRQLIIAFILTAFTSFDSIAQSFIRSFSQPQNLLTKDSKNLFDRYTANESSENVQLIQIGELKDAQSEGTLTFNLPGEPDLFTMKVERAEYVDRDNYLWQGKRILADGQSTPEYFLLIKEKGQFAGDAFVNGHQYTILPVANGYQALIQGQHPGNAIDHSKSGDSSPDEACTMGTAVCYTDILILYTSGALSEYDPYMGLLGRLCIEQLNASFIRSGIKQRARLVGLELWQDAWVNGTATEEASYVQTMLEFPNSIVSQKRNAVDADLVVVLSSGVNYDALLGKANAAPATTPSNGSAVVQAAYAVTGAYVFAHEVGHLFGGRHQNDDSDLPARAHEFDATIGGNTYHYLTIMHTQSIQILNYSNPDVKYLGEATGTSTRNNACMMQSYGCAVSNIMPTDLCRIRATSSFNCSLNRVYVNATYKQENGISCPVAYWQFDYSFDGANYITGAPTLFGSTSVTYPACTETIFFRIKAFDNALNLIGSTFEWYNPPIVCQCAQSEVGGGGVPRPALNTRLEPDTNKLSPMDATVFPNPTMDQFELQVTVDTADELRIAIYNQVGVEVLSFPAIAVGKGVVTRQIDLSGLPAGNYSVQGITKQGVFVHQVVKI